MLMYAASTAARIKNSSLLGKPELRPASVPSKPPVVGVQGWRAGRGAQWRGRPWLSPALQLCWSQR